MGLIYLIYSFIIAHSSTEMDYDEDWGDETEIFAGFTESEEEEPGSPAPGPIPAPAPPAAPAPAGRSIVCRSCSGTFRPPGAGPGEETPPRPR